MPAYITTVAPVRCNRAEEEFLWCPSTHVLNPDMTTCQLCEPHCNSPHHCIRSRHNHCIFHSFRQHNAHGSSQTVTQAHTHTYLALAQAAQNPCSSWYPAPTASSHLERGCEQVHQSQTPLLMRRLQRLAALLLHHLLSPAVTTHIVSLHWAAQNDTWLLIKLTVKGIV